MDRDTQKLVYKAGITDGELPEVSTYGAALILEGLRSLAYSERLEGFADEELARDDVWRLVEHLRSEMPEMKERLAQNLLAEREYLTETPPVDTGDDDA